MQLFYISGIAGNTCALGEEESWHCVRVLRLQEGAAVHMTDGLGNFYEGRMAKVHHKGCLVEILKTTRLEQRAGHRLHVAMAPTKNIERFEWFLEKATEIGIDEITPLICDHSERKIVKPERLEKVLVAAMKQSLKSWLPRLNEPVSYRDFIARDFTGQKLIAWCETGLESELHELYRKGSAVLVLVGPEGDFSKAEVDLSIGAGYIPVSLGESRLRTETAGLVACNTIALMNRIR
ncbi:MAG: 16S rRNA (uracil(1498)-N(3))-methyltransferase [Bacteroidota bacterium]